MEAAVPAIEIADHTDAARIRRPDGEADAAHTVNLMDVRAELMMGTLVPPFIPQMLIKFADSRQKTVRIAKGNDGAVRIGRLEPVAEDFFAFGQNRRGQDRLEQSRPIATAHWLQRTTVRNHRHRTRPGTEGADRYPGGIRMGAEDRMRVRMP